MIQTKTAINIWADLNMDSSVWIDFCVVIDAWTDVIRAEEIIQKAYYDWWENEEVAQEPIADYIGRCLYENGIEFDIYFKDAEEVE